MITIKIVYQAWRNDKNRYKANPRGEGYLTRDMRWAEVMRYCRRKDAEREAKLDIEYGPRA